jgi:hypothetical protein
MTGVVIAVVGFLAVGAQIVAFVLFGRTAAAFVPIEEVQRRHGLSYLQARNAVADGWRGRRPEDPRLREAATDWARRSLEARARHRTEEPGRWRWYVGLHVAATVLALVGVALSLARGHFPPGLIQLALIGEVLRVVVRPWLDRRLRRVAAE